MILLVVSWSGFESSVISSSEPIGSVSELSDPDPDFAKVVFVGLATGIYGGGG